jgi:hypothetical protein
MSRWRGGVKTLACQKATLNLIQHHPHVNPPFPASAIIQLPARQTTGHPPFHHQCAQESVGTLLLHGIVHELRGEVHLPTIFVEEGDVGIQFQEALNLLCGVESAARETVKQQQKSHGSGSHCHVLAHFCSHSLVCARAAGTFFRRHWLR